MFMVWLLKDRNLVSVSRGDPDPFGKEQFGDGHAPVTGYFFEVARSDV
jgi:hypothetical protein